MRVLSQGCRIVFLGFLFVLGLQLLSGVSVLASPSTKADPESCPQGAVCPFVVDDPSEANPPSETDEEESDSTHDVRGTLLFFWGVGCPHCEDAKPFVQRLSIEFPKLEVVSIEVRKSETGRERFVQVIRDLQIKNPGIPAFVYQRHFEIGFRSSYTEARVRRILLGKELNSLTDGRTDTVELPWLGLEQILRTPQYQRTHTWVRAVDTAFSASY